MVMESMSFHVVERDSIAFHRAILNCLTALFNLYTIYLIYFAFEVLGQISNFITGSFSPKVGETK